MGKSDCRWPEENLKSQSAEGFADSGEQDVGLAIFVGVCQAESMKKQASDQSFHDRRYQERKRAEAARKAPKKKVAGGEAGKRSSESRVPSSE
jgi:hypothetical protein